MPKLPVVSGADIVRVLQRLGFEQLRQRGSHVVMRRGGTGWLVPMHRDVKTGTLGGVLRQAGVSADDFIDALKQ